MAQRITSVIFLFFFLLPSAASLASPFDRSSPGQFVPVDQAFMFDFDQQGKQLNLHWQIKPGYYLYRQQISVTAKNAALLPLVLPRGQPHEDEFFGKTEIYPDSLSLALTIRQADSDASVTLHYQGCAAAGFCYPPETRVIPLSAVPAMAEPTTGVQQPAISPRPAETQRASLPFSALWALLMGIGIAFTPCVLPVYPLISGIILGRNQLLSQKRIFLLSMSYVQGMALTYTLMGLIVAVAGLRFQSALQHPYVLTGVSLLFIVLSLSMFGLFTLQLPAALQTRLTLWSNRQQGGSLPGVFLMGALAGLICSPCTTAPLGAILLYIAQSGDLLAGAGTLWLYAFGMGLPLIIVTMSGNKLLASRGPWMQTVKEGFGFVILALPVFLMERVWGEVWGIRLWSLLGICFFGWAFALSLRAHHGWLRLFQVLLLAAALVIARPLQDWAFGLTAASGQTSALHFTRVDNPQQLAQSLQQAQGQITMLDLYANWCSACKEFEKYTFRDAAVQQALAQIYLLQANVTANSASNRTLLQQLNVLGLPTILFFDERGKEIPGLRVTGYLDATAFLAHLRKLSPSAGAH